MLYISVVRGRRICEEGSVANWNSDDVQAQASAATFKLPLKDFEGAEFMGTRVRGY